MSCAGMAGGTTGGRRPRGVTSSPSARAPESIRRRSCSRSKRGALALAAPPDSLIANLEQEVSVGILPIIHCRPLLACALVAALAGASHSSAQESHEIDASDLAKQTQNPVADLVALPFQFNFNNGGDFADRTFLNLNFQPVIPFSVCDSWKA